MADETEHHEDEALNGGKSPGANKPSQDNEPDSRQQKREGFADPLEFLNAELERAEAEKTEYHDKMVRIAAEMDNLRKRTAKDVADARQYSIASFAREMLAVSDNLRRALDAVPDESRESGDEGLKALIEGVELTERSMLQAMEKSGVKRISPKGERFDPNFHQAMFEVPNEEAPHNSVIEVVQDGYVIGERVLRPAMVGVAKGGPRKSATEPESGGDEVEAQEAGNTSGES